MCLSYATSHITYARFPCEWTRRKLPLSVLPFLHDSWTTPERVKGAQLERCTR